ncbi:uncharacterized protein LOC142329052 [Lycorma delicatula]|uniref:uncharacterized protein LOC142329052 n=1 Tax=Lycorma delicatula TaxID=130591 RepID=UPI003F510EA1
MVFLWPQKSITINKRSTKQQMVDFVQFTTMGPEPVHHTCSNDQFIISGGTPINPICGENSGNHMYINAGVGTTPVKITFITAGGSFPRKWKVRICQIPCSSNYRGLITSSHNLEAYARYMKNKFFRA